MKKYLILSFLSLVTCVAFAAQVSVTIPANTMTNVFPLLSGGAKVTALQATATTATNALVYLIDTPTGYTWYTNAAYTNTTQYGSNYITTWTNYFGATNSWTNVVLVTMSNYVAGASNMWPTRAVVTVQSNSTATYTPVSWLFENGLWATNASGAIVQMTFNIVQ